MYLRITQEVLPPLTPSTGFALCRSIVFNKLVQKHSDVVISGMTRQDFCTVFDLGLTR